MFGQQLTLYSKNFLPEMERIQQLVSFHFNLCSDAIFAFPCQHRWMSHCTKAVTVSQEGRLNYHFQGCALHQRGTHIYRQDSHKHP
ncbi:hypothetical protein OJAV_G00157100 [Oryzias javanicus]|uniref:Uncharacterized protein n=1 Tax=Oryzias javanicus TaxID=123683 RepID=A0A437CIT9_ORYJA|nr:hypothetical protein OJAV_G00157100 [Oryzias javanicus]